MKYKYLINGRVVPEWDWYQAVEEGTYQIFYDDGQLWYEGVWSSKGEWHGRMRYYHQNGQLDKENVYVHGEERPELLLEEHRLERVILIGE